MTILRCMTHMQCDYKGVGGLGRFVRAWLADWHGSFVCTSEKHGVNTDPLHSSTYHRPVCCKGQILCDDRRGLTARPPMALPPPASTRHHLTLAGSKYIHTQCVIKMSWRADQPAASVSHCALWSVCLNWTQSMTQWQAASQPANSHSAVTYVRTLTVNDTGVEKYSMTLANLMPRVQ